MNFKMHEVMIKSFMQISNYKQAATALRPFFSEMKFPYSLEWIAEW